MSVLTNHRSRPLLAGVIALACATIAAAGDGLAPGSAGDVDKPNPNVRFEQKLGDKVPLDLAFTDEDGNPITLGQCVNGKPTILVLAYYRCPMLCGEVFGGVLDAIRHLPGNMTCGNEFNIVCVSFDPKEKHELARTKKMHFVTEYGRKEADWGWHWLTGKKPSIDALTAACGFHYEFDPMLKEYNHPSGIMVLTPEGAITRYFPGIEYLDRGDDGRVLRDSTRTLRLTLLEAGEGKVEATPSDKVFLTCYQYNPHTGKYSANVMLIMRAGGILTLLIIAGVYARTSWKLPGVRVGVVGLLCYLALLPFIMYATYPLSPMVARAALLPLGIVAVLIGRWIWKSARRAQAAQPLAGAGVE